ncbi:MAG: imidazoleglycerol-phosphate dehydratase HisB [Acidimicrobiaceae bacterium]|nr:imidazoleglycerol-phosphate dehydratase HisB [Acidimicrobiaceae bacterium]
MSQGNRSAVLERVTAETKIYVTWNLDGSGGQSISTGLPFFDHMLAQLSKHSHSDLTVKVEGDLSVDAHHSVEDTGIVLGQAFAKAIGQKVGIRRFASLSLPLDEALVSVALDLSGRSFLEFHGELGDGNLLGTPGFDPQLAEEFFRAFVAAAGISAHIDVVRGRNFHHIVEAIFKCFARTLKDAITVEGDSVPSTKGTL